jgi:hypothetical protein
MLRVNSHTFPSNVWIHRITKKKESDRCDLCKTLWIAEDRFKTEKDLPENIQEGQPKEVVARERFWRLRPDGIVVLPPSGNKTDIFCILEHKRMSDVCDQYIIRAKQTVEDQYVSLRSDISAVIQCQGWKVEQITFITGARSVNKQDLSKNLKFFNVSEASIQSMYSKLAMRVFDVYTNILKCMYNIRFSGGPTRLEASPEAQPTPIVITTLIRTTVTFHPDKYNK